MNQQDWRARAQLACQQFRGEQPPRKADHAGHRLGSAQADKQRHHRALRESDQRQFAALEPPFFESLVAFMSAGPIVAQVLEGENAVAKYREVMGATNPANAAEGTIRKQFAESVGENSVHGSDSPENAEIEIRQFFAGNEIVG